MPASALPSQPTSLLPPNVPGAVCSPANRRKPIKALVRARKIRRGAGKSGWHRHGFKKTPNGCRMCCHRILPQRRHKGRKTTLFHSLAPEPGAHPCPAAPNQSRWISLDFPRNRAIMDRALERACSLAVRRLPNRPSGQWGQLRLRACRTFF